MILHRFVAIVLLMVVSAFQVEAGAGMLRDDEVHHEDLAVALAHSGSGGYYGYEDIQLPGHSPGGQHSHDGQHQHGTTGDHCTHQHLVGLACPFRLAFSSILSFQAFRSGTDHFDRIPRALFRPPRA